MTIGIAISYRNILRQSLLRVFETNPPLFESHFPLTVKLLDGLDGSSCHQIYNQYELHPTHDSDNIHVWKNISPNSSFGVRPFVLLAQKECLDNVKFIMKNIIYPEVNSIEQDGLLLSQGMVQAKIIRSMLDGKMSGILRGARGAHCQLCTANLKELKDQEMLRAGFPIN